MQLPKRIFLSACGAVFLMAASHAQPIGQYRDALSNFQVTSMVEDTQGFIWMGTRHGLSRYDGSSYLTFYATSFPGGLKSDYIYSLDADTDGSVWIGCKSGYYNYRNGKFLLDDPNTIYNPNTHVLNQDEDHFIAVGVDGIARFGKVRDGGEKRILTFLGIHQDSRTSNISHVVVSSLADIWYTVSAENGCDITVLDRKVKLLEQISMPGVRKVTDMAAGINGSVWIATDKGFRAFDETSRNPVSVPGEVSRLVKEEDILLVKKYGAFGVLVGLRGKGLYLYDFRSRTLSSLHPEEHLNTDQAVCLVDTRGNVWIADGLSAPRCLVSGEPSMRTQTEGTLSHILQMDMDRDGFLHLRTSSGYYTYDPVRKDILGQLAADGPLSVQMLDSQNRLWLTRSGSDLSCFRLEGGTMIPMVSYPLNAGINAVSEDGDGNIWVFTTNREISLIRKETGILETGVARLNDLYSFPVTDRRSGTIYINSLGDSTLVCTLDGLKPNETALNSISCVLTATDGALWYGTFNKGLVRIDPETRLSEHFDQARNLPESDIKSILEDREGNLWICTSRYITRYDPAEKEFRTIYDHGLSQNDFYENLCACPDSEGNLYFGGNGGYTKIHPADWKGSPARQEPPLLLEEFLANGQGMPVSASETVLDHRQRNIQFRFATIDYGKGSRNSYACMLEGLETDWTFTTANIASFNNLRPGKYCFRVKGLGMDGAFLEQELAVPFRIRPSAWESPLAMVLYAIFSLGLVFAIIVLLTRIRTQQERLSLNEQKEELQQEHIDFLTDISHEFRTPLSLIYGPLKQFREHETALSDQGKASLEMMERNTERLMDLTEQILSNSAQREKERKLRVSPQDVPAFIGELADIFRQAALEKDIHFSASVDPAPEEVNFDREKVEKIMYNLLSNAFKYTPEHGTVSLEFAPGDDGTSQFRVRDDGPGISREMQSRLFIRFDRMGAEKTDISGSGIGLHYAWKLTRIHKGSLRYESPEGKGSLFTLTIPTRKEAYTQTELTASGTLVKNPAPQQEGEVPASSGKATLVLVEDNEDVRVFLKSFLSEKYNVLPCSDGEEGMDRIRNTVPDIVVSDVMMPRKNGFTLCRELKADPDLYHIPVILLTAKADTGSSIKGLEGGAEAYITKPFDPEFLAASIETLLENRRKIQRRIISLTSSSLQKETVREALPLKQEDKVFLEKIHAILDQNLSQPDFSVESLSASLFMSYSSLYAKVKALTGQPPLTYVNTYKMNIAREMLQSGKYTVTEVAYEVGAANSSSFARSFRKQFGKSPTEVVGKD